MTLYCDVTNSVYPATMTTIRHCSILKFGTGAYNQAVAPSITRPLHATGWTPCLIPNWASCLSDCMGNRYKIFICWSMLRWIETRKVFSRTFGIT